MNFQFIVEEDTAKVRTERYLENIGYVKQSASSFKRGNFLGSLTGMSPEKWQSRVILEWGPGILKSHWSYNTSYQLVTGSENASLTQERENLRKAIDEGKWADPSQSRQTAQNANWQIVGLVGFSLVPTIFIIFIIKALLPQEWGHIIVQTCMGFWAGLAILFLIRSAPNK